MAIDLPIGAPRIEVGARPLESGPALSRVAGGSALFSAGTVLGLGLNYAYAVVLARWLGPEPFGLYALGLGCFNLMSVVALGGLDTALLRFIPALSARGDADAAGRMIRAALLLALSLSGLFAAGLFLSAPSLARDVFHHDDAGYVLRWFALSVPLFVTSSVALAALQAFREVRWRTSVKYLCEPVVKFAATAVLFAAGWTLLSPLAALPIALALTTVLLLWPLRPFLMRRRGATSFAGVYRDVVRYSAPLFGGLVFAGIATRSDVLLLGYWLPADQVGIYSAAFQTSAVLAVVLGTFESVATPFLSESIAGNDTQQVRALAAAVARWTVIGTLPLCMLMALFAEDIMALFGDGFRSGGACLIILAAGQFVNSAMGCTNGMLLWAGRSKLVMWNGVAVSAVQIVLYCLLIPRYGIAGAAVATSASLIVTVLVRVVQVHRVLRVWPYQADLVKPLAAGLAAALPVVAVKLLGAPPIGFLVGAFALSYLGVLAMLGFHESDRAVVLQLTRRLMRRAGE